VRIFYRQVGDSGNGLPAVATDVASGALIEPKGVQSGIAYEARATITTRPDRLKTFTSWVTTTEATVPLQVILGEVAADVAGTLESLRADHNSLRALVTDLADTVSGAGLSNRLTLGRVQTRVGTAEATVKSEIITRASEVAAIGGQITEINASLISATSQIEGNANAISITQSEVTDLDGVVTALSVDLTSVEAQVDDATAGGYYKIEASAGTGDVEVTATTYLRATLGGDAIEVGQRHEIYIEGGELKGRTVNIADQQVWVTSEGDVLAVIGEDEDGLVLQNIRVGVVTFDQLSSANGKLVLKGSGDDASIEVFS
jgi:hypothetical protein